MSDSPYRSGVSIDALAAEVDALRRDVDKLKTHVHDVREDRYCPGCGGEVVIVTTPWTGMLCECGHDLTTICRSEK